MIKNIYKQYYCDAKINNEVNDKVFRDFFKVFKVNLVKPISNILQEEFRQIVVQTALVNEHRFVTQSDLWSMLYIEQKEILNIEEQFEATMYQTMFKEQMTYLEQNVAYKDEYAELKELNQLNHFQQKHAYELFQWTNKYIEQLEKKYASYVNSEQLSNKLTGEEVKKFFNEKYQEIIKIFKWQRLGFEIIIE